MELSPLVTALLAVAVVITVAQLLGQLADRLGQPRVLGDIVGGILLGPSLLGAMTPELSGWLFSPEALQPKLSRLSPVLGAVECLTVAPVPVGDRLWVTSDAGRPWEVDPVTLALLSPVGRRADWKGVAPLPWAFPLLLTSGHPAVDPGGHTVWEANFSPMASPGNPAFFRLLRIDDGEVRSWDVVDRATGERARIHQSVHQMASTERFVVLLDAAFHVEASQLVVEAVRSIVPRLRRVWQ
jgi:hypothetical protein